MPRLGGYPPLWGAVAPASALACVAVFLARAEARVGRTSCSTLSAGLAIAAGGLMITLRNPVHSALSFAMVVLGTCGLFLLQAAPFLMAATIIIYAGAHRGDVPVRHHAGPGRPAFPTRPTPREPFLANVAGFVLLGCILVCVSAITTRAAG